MKVLLEPTFPPLQNDVLELILRTYRFISRTPVDVLLENIQHSEDFPDEELADKIEKSEKAFRRDFRLRSI